MWLPVETFEYRVLGKSHYLALHDIELEDGEVHLSNCLGSNALSLVDKLTFVPKGCEVNGWSRPKSRDNSFTALYFDATTLADELVDEFVAADPAPLLYVRDAALGNTMKKLAKAIASGASAVHLESLCIVAASEVLQIRAKSSRGTLSTSQLDQLFQYVEAHLAEDLSVEEMAKVLGLSRFHFSRIFKETTSETPYQFLLGQRVQKAKHLLSSSHLSLTEITLRCGFRTVPQFEEAFRRIVGTRPFAFRPR